MRNYKIYIIASAIVMLGASLALANSNFNLFDFFTEKQSKLESIDDDIIVVSSDDFVITKREYIDYEENIKLIHKANNISFTLTKEELIENMINNRLILHYAKKQNVQVSDEEVWDYAMQTKEASHDAPPLLKELLKELASSLGVSEEEYFTHPKTLENYRNLLLSQKAVEQLYEEGILEDNGDNSALDLFIADLRRSEDSIQVYMD